MSSDLTERQKYGYRRFRALARSLGARIFATAENRLLLVGGQPDFGRLMTCLARGREVPTPARAPTPSELGFPRLCDGELTRHGLQIRSHALTRWSRALECKYRNKEAIDSRQVRAERAEIEQLRNRLRELHDWRRQAEKGELLPGAPYLLSAGEERCLTNLLSRVEGDQTLPPRARWFASLVWWISGATATARYLDSLAPLLRSGEETEQIEQIRTLLQRLHIWKQRCVDERKRAVHAELRLAIRNLAPNLVTVGQLSSRLRGRSFVDHCDLLIGRCVKLLEDFHAIPAARAPAAMASLAACDGRQAQLPRRLVAQCLRTGDIQSLENSVRQLFAEAQNPGYGLLLWALGRLEKLPASSEYKAVQSMLVRGATLDDIAWAQKRDLTDCFDNRLPAVRWVRSFLTELASRNIAFDQHSVRDLLDAARARKDLAVWNELVRWLNGFSRSTFSPKMGTLLRKAILELIRPGVRDLACHDQLHRWLSPPRRYRCPIDAVAIGRTGLQKGLGNMVWYQQLSGIEPSLPKSVRKQLGAIDRRHAELDFLREAITTGRATPGQRKRLEYLLGGAADTCPLPDARLQRSVEQVVLATSMSALRAIVRNAVGRVWREMTGEALPDKSLQWQLDLVGWVRRMDKSQRQLLCEILQTWKTHGAAYKSHLAANAAWLAKARSHGMHLAKWLRPHPSIVQIAGKDVRIDVAHEPTEVFLMGSHFNTCLRPGNCNEMSVLANAYDANKQVLFMYDGSENVVARQLVGVSNDFKMLGFHCYTVIGHDKPQQLHDEYIAAMARYCGQWANRCGLELGDTGKPAEIADHFWYDDGVWKWHNAARQAWRAAAVRQDAAEHVPPGGPTPWISISV